MPNAFTKQVGFAGTKKKGPGAEVCRQRASFTQFFMGESEQLWFCYQHVVALAQCEDEGAEFRRQGVIFSFVVLVASAFFSFILSNIPECTGSLVWIARLSVNLQAGLLGTSWLMRIEDDPVKISMGAFAVVIVFSTVVMLPYNYSESARAGNPCSIFLLLIISLYLVGVVEAHSYHKAFPLFVSYHPIYIGLAGFVVEFAKYFIWDNFVQPALNPHGRRRVGSLKMENAYEGLELQE